MTKRIGPKTLPCGTPEVTGFVLEDYPSKTIFCDLFVKNYLIDLYIFPRNSITPIFFISFLCVAYQTLLKILIDYVNIFTFM